MSDLSIRLKYTERTGKEAKVYFTCHPDDLSVYFETVIKDVFDKSESVIYYTKDMTERIFEGDGELLLSEMQLFVVPVTLRLLTQDCRAMDFDIPYARKMGIPILPIVMEGGLDALYSAADKFGELQYVSRAENDVTAIPYSQKLGKFLSTVLLSEENEELVRSDFGSCVFLSYRKKDRAYANRLIKKIHSDPALSDVAVWYDEFLAIGESFQKNIEHALQKSEALVLLVTPSLLESGNFVMKVEYPAARESGIPIIPIEMADTDTAQLCEAYPGLPSVNEFSEGGFLHAIKSTLHRGNEATEWAARHKYLMGLAYFYGIDMEADRERGLNLIYSAARDNYYDAMMMLWNYYSTRLAPENLDKWLSASIYLYREEHFGEEHPETLDALYELSLIYISKGEYEKANAWLDEGYAAGCKIRGEEHPDTVKMLEAIGWIHRNKGERTKSLQIFERVFAIRRKTLGIEHISTASIVITLLGEYEYFGDYAKILELNKLIYALTKSRFGEGHHLSLAALNKLVTEYRSYLSRTGDSEAEGEASLLLAEGIRIGEREYPLLCKRLGEGHPEALELLMALAESYSLAKDDGRALSLYESMRPHYVTLYGEDSMQVRGLDFRIYNLTDGKDDLEKMMNMSVDELGAFLFGESGDDDDFASLLFDDSDDSEDGQ